MYRTPTCILAHLSDAAHGPLVLRSAHVLACIQKDTCIKHCEASNVLCLVFTCTYTFAAYSSDVRLATTPDLNLLYTADNLFMQIVEPEDISYIYKVRPARNFGGEFVSLIKGVGFNI